MKHSAVFLSLTMFFSVIAFSASAQDDGFIYGKVKTEDDRVYEGPIRWGKEEVYWIDHFNAGKEKNKNLTYLSSRDRDELRHKQGWGNDSWNSIFGIRWDNDSYNGFTHQFSCRFGDIKRIEPHGKNDLDVILQNGRRFSLTGEGYNDVGEEITIIDSELGEIDLQWNRIERIEFMKTPSHLLNSFGKPLIGTVEAFGKKFTGVIQWDHDERVTTDKLDGDSDDGDVSIEFGKIQSIERMGGRCEVTLKSGRKLTLDGSNDVSSGHRGVIVMTNEFASVDIPWREFDKVTFSNTSSNALMAYNEFNEQQELSGTVVTKNGKSISGRIVFDLDEESSFEFLQGKDDEMEYVLTFNEVKRVEPKGSSRSLVQLKSGTKIILEDAQDVDESNQGVLVFSKGATDPVYVRWELVKEIVFN